MEPKTLHLNFKSTNKPNPLGFGFFLSVCIFLVLFPAFCKSEIGKKPAEGTSISTPKEKLAFFEWLLREIYQQVSPGRPVSRGELNSWLNVVSQGASIEGVYHGIILSKEYGMLEKGTASLAAVRFFSEDMAFISLPDGKTVKDPEYKKLSQSYAKQFSMASIYTLKREMGESILHQMEVRKDDREKLSKWFADVAIRWNSQNVSFGLQQRNDSDWEFHHKWAKENKFGLVQWELLNRAHRILNFHGNLIAISAPPAPATPRGK